MPNPLTWLPWAWAPAAGRLIWFTILLVIMMIPVMVLMRRPKSDKPTTWAQAMAGSVYVFALFLLAYAIIPHEFITYCDKYLQWGKDKYIIKSTTQFPLVHSWNWPVSIDAQSIRDVLVVGIYVVFFGADIALFVKWQDRKTKPEETEEKPVVVGRSRFGRPLKAKA
jgi:hypothetical protein